MAINAARSQDSGWINPAPVKALMNPAMSLCPSPSGRGVRGEGSDPFAQQGGFAKSCWPGQQYKTTRLVYTGQQLFGQAQARDSVRPWGRNVELGGKEESGYSEMDYTSRQFEPGSPLASTKSEEE